MLQTLIENWTAIDAIAAIVIAVIGFFYMNIRDLRKEMREEIRGLRSDMHTLWKANNEHIGKLSDVIMQHFADSAAKREAVASAARNKEDQLPKPKE